MLGPILAALLLSQPSGLSRDQFGVPHVVASDRATAFRLAGRAVAEDRLWQMELSRRTARGKMAEVFGAGSFTSDRAVASTGYTDAELQQQFDALRQEIREAFTAYAAGVNEHIAAAKSAKTLPPGYSQNGFEPEPWTVLDSAAISINLFQIFGQGGAGELRNWALLMYLQARPNKAQALDIFDDFLWENDARSPVTVAKEDDPLRSSPPAFPKRSRKLLEDHLKLLPAANLGELLPAIRIASREAQERIAMINAVPYKTGSYAVLVSPRRSATGNALLLSAPQMGHTQPSVVHEMSIKTPEYAAVGMDVPGTPGIAIGMQPNLAWGLTSGVADTADIVFVNVKDEDEYLVDGQPQPLQIIRREIKVKGEAAPRIVEAKRTLYGPVIASVGGGKTLLAQHSASWMKELQSAEAMFGIATATSREEIDQSLRRATVSFNCFVATNWGEIGYRYVGNVPQRSGLFDPRLPAPAGKASAWDGFIPFEKMPHVWNPKSGLVTNWNNKPVEWWPNSDTPVWGRTFRVEALRSALERPGKISLQDVERSAWQIARTDYSAGQMMPIVRAALSQPRLATGGPLPPSLNDQLLAFDGQTLEGSIPAAAYSQFLDSLRNELFLPSTGNFLSPATFRTVTQLHVMLEALEGKTKVDYLQKKSSQDVIRAAAEKVAERWNGAFEGFRPGSIAVQGEPPIPYSDRGTYIQLVEVIRGREPMGRNVLPPGVAESGPHQKDQVPLARAWQYKPMRW
jgi:penicillin amidase